MIIEIEKIEGKYTATYDTYDYNKKKGTVFSDSLEKVLLKISGIVKEYLDRKI